MFDPLLYNLRVQGLAVGLGEWLTFLRGLRAGLGRDLDGLYHLGRALLVHSETSYDAYDLAFAATFANLSLDPAMLRALEAWLADPAAFDEARKAGLHELSSVEELMDRLRRTLEAQKSRHERGDRWVGTGGTSPYGNSGRANAGVRIGGDAEGGGGRAGLRLAEERRWRGYRTDAPLDVRDFQVALRALRNLAREGPEVLDLDDTVRASAANGGEIDLVFEPDRANRVRLTLLMDAGGSMAPHAELVSRLFTAARRTRTFKSFEPYYFHNCVYRWLYRDSDTFDRLPTARVLRDLRPDQRLIFIGDASMASFELFSSDGSAGWASEAQTSTAGIDWLRAFARRCPASIWLNPDPPRLWEHPTVAAIAAAFRMFPLTLDGLRDGIAHLRAPR